LPELLETKNRKEQEERVEQPNGIAQAVVDGITILILGDAVIFGVVGQPTPDVLVQALEIVRNDFLKAIAKHEAEQETKQLEELAGEDIQELEQS
jgi:hypothetical protein